MKHRLIIFFFSVFCQFVVCQNITLATSCPDYSDSNGTYYPTAFVFVDKVTYSNYKNDVCINETSQESCLKYGYQIKWSDNKWSWAKVGSICNWSFFDDTCRSVQDPPTVITIATSSTNSTGPVGLTDWTGSCSPNMQWDPQEITVSSPCPSAHPDASGKYTVLEDLVYNRNKYVKQMIHCFARVTATDCAKNDYEIQFDNYQWNWINAGSYCMWSSIDKSCRPKSVIDGVPPPPKIIIAKGGDVFDRPTDVTNWICTNIVLSVSDDSLKKNLSYYPNPSTGEFNLDFATPYENVEVTVVNELGQNIMTQSYKNKASIQIDLKKQNDGVYIVKIVTGDKKEAVIKLIKSNN